MKKKSKPKFSSPYEPTVHKTEWTCAAKLAEWMNKIIEEKKFSLGKAEVETTIEGDRKRPDIIIFERLKNDKVLCVIEAKQPYFDVCDETELKIPAWQKAVKRKAPYFATCNFQWLVWFNTERVNRMESVERHGHYHLSEITNLDCIEESGFSIPIISGLTKFLQELTEVFTGKKPEPLLPIDEILIAYLHEKVNRLARYYTPMIRDKAHKDTKFKYNLQKWFVEQQWQFTWQDSDYVKVARQTAYLLVNKILFYNVLQAKRPSEFDKLEISKNLTKGGLLQGILQAYFDRVLRIDYETIYSTDFIDQTAFPDDKNVVYEVKTLIDILDKYDFSKIGEVIGTIFQRLIPLKERHILGQYFTNSDVVDLILKFCLKHEDKVLDPSCGAGTFLMRAYHHKKIMNDRLSHIDILESLWGIDIAKFPSHLATINLAIPGLEVDKNYPNIIQEDFFNLLTSPEGLELPESWRKGRARQLNMEEREITYPRWFDCIVGNPPYTRQEEIPEITGKESYKEKLIKSALYDVNDKKIANISKRAGIHAYFFVHGLKFLKNEGRFGFIVSNSWLDVDYGKGLQELFLKNYKIIAIIESKVERWFEEADINTCIVILEKQSDKKQRDENFVKFVYLFKPFRHFIPPVQEKWEEQVKRLDAIDSLIKTILPHKEFYQNEELRIFPKSQKDLWEEGTEEDKYIGAKWGKYIRAPEIFFKILEKGKGKLLSLGEIVTFGGYIHDNNVKDKFPKTKIVLSSRGIDKITVRKIDKSVTIKGVKPSGNSRLVPDIVIARTFNDTFLAIYNADGILFKRFYKILLNNKSHSKNVCLALNSTLQILFWEYIGIAEALGALNVYKDDFNEILIPNPKYIKIPKRQFNNFMNREIKSIFEELGATSPEEVSLDKVKPDRRELDKIVMGEILGLTDEEQLEVYRAVVDLVKSRIDKAKSLNNNKKAKNGIYVDAAAETVIKQVTERLKDYK